MESRDFMLRVRITSDFHEELKKISSQKGMTVSSYVRFMAGLEIASRKLNYEREQIKKKVESKELDDPIEIDRAFDDLLDRFGKYELTLGQFKLGFEGINTMRENMKRRAVELAS